jgi:hypothetical protein
MKLLHLLKKQLNLSPSEANKCLDRIFLLLGIVTIDILALDEIIHSRHGNYEEQNLSLEEVILKHYGQPAIDTIEAIFANTETQIK